MGIFRKSAPSSESSHPLAAALRTVYQEEGIPLGTRFEDHLRKLPSIRLFICKSGCPPCVHLSGAPQTACHTCGRTLTEEKVPVDSITIADLRSTLAAEAHLRYATECHRAGNPATAEKSLTRVIQLSPKCEDAYHDRAEARIAMGNSAGGIQDCDEAIRLNPKAADTYLTRGAAKAQVNDLAGCVEDTTKALSLGFSMPIAYLNRGMSFVQLGDLDHARADLKRFLELAPSDERAANVRGLLSILG